MRHPKSSSNTNIQQSIGVRWASTPQELQAEELLRCCELSRQLDAPNLGPKPAAMVISSQFFCFTTQLVNFKPSSFHASNSIVFQHHYTISMFLWCFRVQQDWVQSLWYILNIPKYSAPFCISASSYLKLKGKRDDCNSTDSGSRNSSPKI